MYRVLLMISEATAGGAGTGQGLVEGVDVCLSLGSRLVHLGGRYCIVNHELSHPS